MSIKRAPLIVFALVLAFLLVIMLPRYHLLPGRTSAPNHVYIKLSPVTRVPASTDPIPEVRFYTFRLIFKENENVITVWSNVFFANESETHYLDMYLPYKVSKVTNMTDTTIKAQYHPDPIDGTYSLVRFTILRSGVIYFDINVINLAVPEMLGEKSIVLTFGPPRSQQYLSLMNDYSRRNELDLTRLTNVWLTIGVGRDYEFSSDVFPNPTLQSVTESGNFATWILDFSGPLSDFYVSVRCVVRTPMAIRVQDLALLLLGILISLLAQMIVDIITSPRAASTRKDQARAIRWCGGYG